MGGYNAGEVASGMATTVIVAEMRQILEQVLGYEKEKIAKLKSAGAFSLPPKKAA